MRSFLALVLLGATLMVVWGCGGDEVNEEELRDEVVVALDAFAAELVADRPTGADEYAEMIQSYLEGHPAFFGSAVVLLDRWGIVVASHYVHRTEEGFAILDLTEPPYRIEEQEWLLEPLLANAAVWMDPYFDEGRSYTWVATRSLPVRNSEGIFAIVTTDLRVKAPTR